MSTPTRPPGKKPSASTGGKGRGGQVEAANSDAASIERKKSEKGATGIQAAFRAKKARREVQEKREQKAASLKIQASFRGRKGRQRSRVKMEEKKKKKKKKET